MKEHKSWPSYETNSLRVSYFLNIAMSVKLLHVILINICF